MAHVIKKGSIKVPTQPKDYDLQATGLVFKSYDNQIALEFNVEQQNGTPADLLGANLRLLMFIYDEVDGMITKEPIPFITKNLITESFLNGQVVYILPEAMKAYNGMVEAYVYIEYPDGSTSDNLGFTFRMKRSAIDGLAQDKADYFIADFQQLLDGVKQETTDAVNEVLAKVEAVSKNVSSAQNDLTILEDRIDQTNQQIGDLGKLKKMYSNSIDFGGYDYSGNPNLMNNLSFSDFAVQSGAGTISDGGKFLKINKTSGTNLFVMAGYKNSAYYLTPVLPNTTYTITYVLRKSSNFVSQSGKRIFLRYRLNQNDVTNNLGELMLDSTNVTAEFTTYTKTFTTGALVKPNSYYFQVLVEEGLSGEIELSYEIKLERGSTATAYQPNLLDDPYWVGKTSLGKNIANKGTTFPIKSSAYEIYKGNTEEELMIGQTYTITLKGTKPASQTFVAYNYWNVNFGDLKPVEGLTDVWSLTFTPTKLEPGLPKDLRIFQSPKETAGAVQIDWLKIEKGDTRTPNISEYKYFGEGLKDSNNPNDYSWDVTPEYTEKGLNDSVSLTWIAHRGNNSTAPENSIVAFENVYRHQAIETDIQLTSDNRWVVMHDETVDRTTNGTGNISDMTYDQFRALRIDTGANVDKLTDDEKIPPNLEEFLLICKKNNRIPVVEIKATGGYTKEQLQLIKTISDGIGMTEKTIFISFNYDMLVLMREIFPFNELQWVYQGTINTDVITKLKTLGLPCGLDINENNASLTKDNVNLLHANRLKIGAWTVEYNSFEKMKDLGIDYITTNSPSGYLKYAELSLLNGFTPTNDNGQVPQFAAELEGGYVFLSFNVKDGANNNQLTEIAKLPDWAIPHEKQYNQCMIRTSSGVSLATFDTQGWKHSTGVTEGTITIGLGWSSRTTWAAGQCIYKID